MRPANEQTRQFIEAHAGDDVRQLALQAGKHPLVDIPYALRQIEGRQKARRKLPTLYANAETEYPATLSMEQCSGEPAARYKAQLAAGNTLIDMTGGLGIDTLFMAGNFRQVTYIERNQELLQTAQHNFRLFGKNNIQCLSGDSIQTVSGLAQPVDWIYIDPARRSRSGQKTVLPSDCEPDITQILPLLQQKAGQIMVKLSPMLDLNAALRQLPGTTEIHVVSTDNECKELLFIIAGQAAEPPAEPAIVAVQANRHGTRQFRFTQTEERLAAPSYTDRLRTYLYEPDSALLKAGAFKSVAARYGLEKLHPNSHLYTSDSLLTDFCGRIFHTEDTFGWQKADLKRLQNEVAQANIAVRNFPAGTDAVRKKLRLNDGGGIFLFATTLADGKHVLIRAQKAEN